MAKSYETRFITGECMYPHLNDVDSFGNWSLLVEINKEEASFFKALGVKSKPKDVNGRTFMTFKRPQKKADGTPLAPPQIFDKANNRIGEAPAKMGNGTKVTIKIGYWQTPKGAGTRLEAVRIEELVLRPDRDPNANESFIDPF